MPNQTPPKTNPSASNVGGQTTPQHSGDNPSQDRASGNNQDGTYEKAVADRLSGRPEQLGSPSVGNVVSNAGKTLTTNQGLQIPEDDDSLKLGLRGPTLLEDFHLREKITHFDHERIPERVVHARGAAAHGYFELTESIEDYTTAELFTRVGERTPVFVRFSTVAGSRGSADLARDVRGFATKFYTRQGNFDLVGNNMPVFFIQDGIKFPDFVHAVKPEPHNEIPQAASAHDTFWDFVSLQPESMHMVLWTMSGRAIPRSFRTMEGFGVHTFRLINARGEATLVKYHWKPVGGAHSLVWDEALKINGKDPDFHRRDLWESIEMGQYPEYEFGVQLVPETEMLKLGFDLQDPTKIIPEELVPVKRIGRMVLDRNPDNFFAETEQVAFHPGHLLPGMDFTNDPLLHARLFSYIDTQITRLGGPNFHELPINRPLCPVHNNQRDGFMRQTIVQGKESYQPNSVSGGCPFLAGDKDAYRHYPAPAEDGAVKARVRSNTFADHFSQANLFWRSQSDVEKQQIIDAYSFELSKVQDPAIRSRVVGQIVHIAQELADGVAGQLGIPVEPVGPAVQINDYGVQTSPALSLDAQPKGDITGRKIAVLVHDGVDDAAIQSLQALAQGMRANAKIVGPRATSVTTAGGVALPVDYALASVGSVLFDAVYVPDCKNPPADPDPRALLFISEAYKHFKAVGAGGSGALLVAEAARRAGIQGGFAGPGLVIGKSEDAKTHQAFLDAVGEHRWWQRPDALKIPV
ncbi:catalase [Cupriavidus sp.]|jgi:catalase|uniref:catalase n=1 Tax=Cupriavidus sp. TaxID=1873897 RepID=UPI0025C54E25|nr:catalase [Cupriavidus sp.]MCA3187929.1 catalase [Cupriavidus sp.]MCA3188788.1 catalase [Cupriavidus sp.]MCA3198508.1 catalase [Cupriavidus sp.]MCA3201254.1 catalase [Cupriavidus sp.]MCA3208464.1 catalase [Cupriavidus sp.]